jgi:hypothetical protein
MSDKAALHWSVSCRLFRSTVTKNESDRDAFSEHVFAHNSPIDHEHLLVVIFGFLQSYFASLGDSHGIKQTQEFWAGIWGDWKDMTSIQHKLEDFQLLETVYMSCVRGTFISDATNRNSTSPTRRAVVTMASTPGTASIFPTVACMFLDFAFDLCDEGNAPMFRQTMRDAVNHALK